MAMLARKLTPVHTPISARLMKTTKTLLEGFTEVKARDSKAWSKVDQRISSRAREPVLLSFQSEKSFLVKAGKMYWSTWPTAMGT